jgi:hypothetical protein
MVRTMATKTINLERTILADLALAIDPVKFAQSLGIDPDPWQRDVLLSAEKRIIILAARQSGKSMICAIYALWHALNHPGAVVLVLSPSLRQSSLLFKTIVGFYRNELNRPIPADIESALTLRLANKSTIVALPGLERTIRGYSGVSLIIFDESALIDDDTYRAVRPMAAVSDSKVFAIGTPHGQRGWFWDSFEHSDEFSKVKITADQCPRISKEFLERERREMGEWWFKQEYGCIFTENEASIFRMDLIEASIKDFPELDINLDDELDDAPEWHDADLKLPESGREKELDLDFGLGL